MRALVLLAHPDPQSFSAALAAAALRGLAAGGHEARLVDLYAQDFDPVMTRADRLAYETGTAVVDPVVAAQAEHVRWADTLVFVFPTWWSGLPAILKGWLERVLVPGVAFELDERTRKVRPTMQHVTRVVGITTYGSPRLYVTALGDGGRRTVARALRLVCGRRTRATWLGLHDIDRRTDAERRTFLAAVEAKVAQL